VNEGDFVGIYKRSKYLAEKAVLEMAAREAAPVVVVNPAAPVGPRDIKPTPTGKMILDAAAGRVPAYIDTGLNIVHVDDVAEGHVLALERGRIGERYVLGGENMTLLAILTLVAEVTDGRPPFVRLPEAVVWPAAVVMEALARVSKIEPMMTRAHLKMARKKMYYSSAKAVAELGYSARPVRMAVEDAVAWFRANGMLRR
jgi:dihydroflavonol-4-reductase